MVDKVKESVTNASDKLKKLENLADKQARTTEAHFEKAMITMWIVVILVVILLVAAALSNRDLLLGTNAPRPIAIKDLQESAEDITRGVDEQVKSSGRDTANKIGKLQKESSDQFREIKDLIRNNRVFPGQGPGQLTDDRAALKEVKGLIVGIHEALKAQGEAESKWGEGSDRERKRLENDLVSKLDRMRDEVAKTIGRVGSESKAASDAVTNRMDVVTKKIDAVSEETRKASDNVEKAIAARLGDIEKESIKKAEELSGRLARLEASLHLPKTEELYSVAIVVDGGQELANYGDRQVRQAVIDVVSQAVRQTEARPIGVIWNRGADPVVIEMLDRHFIENLAEIKSRLSEGLVATPGERSDWSVGLERALGLLALQESPRRRVVQISFAESAETTSPEREAKLAETARKHKIEVWTIELMTPGSTPAKGFVDAALKSGGQFVSVPISERSAQDGAAMSFSGRLRSILLDALSLPESMELPR
jgi:cell division protein FtsL